MGTLKHAQREYVQRGAMKPEEFVEMMSAEGMNFRNAATLVAVEDAMSGEGTQEIPERHQHTSSYSMPPRVKRSLIEDHGLSPEDITVACRQVSFRHAMLDLTIPSPEEELLNTENE